MKKIKFNPDEILISTDKLELILLKFSEKIKKTNDWIAPLGIFISLLVALLVSDFKEKFGIQAIQWETITIIFLIISFFWLMLEIVKIRRNPTIQDLLIEIKSNSQKKLEFTAIFFIKRFTDENIYRILTHHNLVWDCLFLPYSFYSPAEEFEKQLQPLRFTIASILGVDSGLIVIEHLKELSLVSNKFSQRHKQNTEYYFEFFPIVVTTLDTNNILYKDTFTVGGKEFFWKTLDELEAHPMTSERNKDIIMHLRDNYDIFFNQVRNAIQ